MAGLPISARNTICMSCKRQLIADDLSKACSPFYKQVRGKKKTAKRITTINVKLLEDVKGYGKKDSITPVEPGRMRNTWYPQQKAEYVTASHFSGLRPKKIEAVRNFEFGIIKQEEDTAPTSNEEKMPGILTVTRLLSPQRATEIMEAALPSHITFYRSPISNLEPEISESLPPARATSSAAAVLDAASVPLQPAKSLLDTIYGSVSTADIADSLKAVLSQTDEGARIVLAAEDIKILVSGDVQSQDIGIEGDRLKALGDFQVEARVKGGEAITRTVSVRAQSQENPSMLFRKVA